MATIISIDRKLNQSIMINSIQNRFKNSPTIKALLVLAITIILLIPAYKIETLISERKKLQAEVVNEINSKWGEHQTITGPIISVPYTELENEGTPNETRITKHIFVLPETLKINGKVVPNVKKRSIYQAFLYSADIALVGSFNFDKIAKLGLSSEDLQWDKSTINFGISDPHGISEVTLIELNNTPLSTDPGVATELPLKHGINSSTQLDQMPNATINFNAQFSLKGSSRIDFIPLGKSTVAELESTWPDPSFAGSFLPEASTISRDGFTANWKVLDFNRSFGQVWNNYFPSLDEWKFGVNLVDPVDVYQKTNRAIKYGFMIIALTFTFFYLFEILKKLKIHPIQYTIVGFAVLIFYILLLALSEQVSFSLAFLLSATAIVGIVGYYFYFISHSLKITLLFSLIFSFIYGFIYVILNAEAYSLVIGSLGLLLLLFLVIHLTRNVNWYQTSDSEEPEIQLATE